MIIGFSKSPKKFIGKILRVKDEIDWKEIAGVLDFVLSLFLSFMIFDDLVDLCLSLLSHLFGALVLSKKYFLFVFLVRSVTLLRVSVPVIVKD